MPDLFSTHTPPAKAPTFDEFWGQTPKAGSKHQAKKKFQSFSADARTAATESVQSYYAWWTKANPQASTLHVSTYLNQRRWEDDDWRPAEGSSQQSTDVLTYWAKEINGTGKMWSKPGDEIIQQLLASKMVTKQRMMDRLPV